MKKDRIGFDDFYRDLYGERWQALRAALSADNPSSGFFDPPLLKPYFLDPASIEAARALGVQPGDRVLDLCAAPGGKALVLAATLGDSGSLTVNERSGERRARLVRVLREHLPENVAGRIRVTGHDAAVWGVHDPEAYDRILLDVPCSSERHVLKSPPHLAAWSPARTKNLAVQAYAMLSSAFLAVKPGGTILYSTCSLSPFENDRVVERLVQKKKDRVTVESCPIPEAERTDFGSIVLPDRCGGMGPMYWARIRKTAEPGATSDN